LEKYKDSVVPGGMIFVDSSLINTKVERKDVTTYYIPATRMANEAGISTLANMIMMGKLLKECPGMSFDNTEIALKKIVSAKHADLYDSNLKAIETGYHFE
jgi:2-oxoglutarate ferredoxin oxidoreductase subunit gamma